MAPEGMHWTKGAAESSTPQEHHLRTNTVSIPVVEIKTSHIIDSNTVIHRPEQATLIRSSVDPVLPHLTIFSSCGTLRLVEKEELELAVPHTIDSVEHTRPSSIALAPGLRPAAYNHELSTAAIMTENSSE